jgi:lactoylglutathione lyase
MPQAKPSALSQIARVDYTVIFVTDMPAMRHFYEEVMGFRLSRTLSERWHEYSLGDTTLVLAAGGRFGDQAPSPQQAALQLAFKVAPDAVARCAQELEAKGITLVSPLTDHAFGHRTIFFRDPGQPDRDLRRNLSRLNSSRQRRFSRPVPRVSHCTQATPEPHEACRNQRHWRAGKEDDP